MSEPNAIHAERWRARGQAWGITVGACLFMVLVSWWYCGGDWGLDRFVQVNTRRITGPVQKQIISVGMARADVDRVMGKPDQESTPLCWIGKPGTPCPWPYPIPHTRLKYDGQDFDVILNPTTGSVIAVEDHK